jgi:capsular polysaccharide transport system permease protein
MVGLTSEDAAQSMSFSRRTADIEERLAGVWRSLPKWAATPFFIIVALPTLLTAIYMFLIAAPIYVSETQFVVQSRSQQSPSAFGTILASVGLNLNATSSDSYEVIKYMTSRSALTDLVAHHDFLAIIDRPEADFLARFPRFFERNSFENLYESYERYITATYDSTTGINTLQVRAFRAKDAYKIANALLESGEGLVNQLNNRAMEDVLQQSQAQVDEAQKRAVDAQLTLTKYRTREKLIDPTQSSVAGSKIVNEIDTELASAEAQRNGLAALAPQSPELPSLDQKIRSLEEQRSKELSKVAGESNSLAPKIGEYERLTLERDFAVQLLKTAETELEQARTDANKKRTYLDRISAPHIADQAMLPERWRTVMTVFVSALVAYTIFTLVVAGLREHKQI